MSNDSTTQDAGLRTLSWPTLVLLIGVCAFVVVGIVCKWQTVAVIAGLCAGLGVATDRLILRPRGPARKRIHGAITAEYVQLDDTDVPDLPVLMARSTLRVAHSVLGSKWLSVRAVSITCLVSMFLTVHAFVVSLAIDHSQPYIDHLYDVARFIRPPKLWYQLVNNYVFDALTILVTLQVLRIVQQGRVWRSVVAVLTDVILAVLFAAACLFTLVVEMNLVDVRRLQLLESYETFWATTVEAPKVYQALFDLSCGRRPGGPIDYSDGILYASTTFLPTAIYMLILSGMMLGKSVLAVLRRVAIHLFGVAADDPDPTKLQVGTLIGCAFSVVALVAKTVAYFVSQPGAGPPTP